MFVASGIVVWELNTDWADTFTIHTGSVDVLVHNFEPGFCPRPDPNEYSNPNQRKAIELELKNAKKHKQEGRTVRYIDDKSKIPPRNQNGDTPPNLNKRPDQLVNGEFRDVFSPKTANPESALKGALDKVKEGQAQRVDIVLDPNRAPDLTLESLQSAFTEDIRPDLGDYSYFADNGEEFKVKEITVLFKDERTILYSVN